MKNKVSLLKKESSLVLLFKIKNGNFFQFCEKIIQRAKLMFNNLNLTNSIPLSNVFWHLRTFKYTLYFNFIVCRKFFFKS